MELEHDVRTGTDDLANERDALLSRTSSFSYLHTRCDSDVIMMVGRESDAAFSFFTFVCFGCFDAMSLLGIAGCLVRGVEARCPYL